MGSIFAQPINTSQGSSGGSIFANPITTTNYNQPTPTPKVTPTPTPKVATPLTGMQKALQTLQGIGNNVEKVIGNIKLSFTAPKVSPALPESVFKQVPAVNPQKPVQLEPNQKKLNPNQLQTVAGNFVGKAVSKIANENISILGVNLGSIGGNLSDLGAILSGASMFPDTYKEYNKLDPWSKLNEATKIFGMLPAMGNISSEIKGAKDVASAVRGLIAGYGVGSLLNFAAQEPTKRSIGEAIKPNLNNMLFAYFTGSTGLPNPFEFLKKQPDISKADYIQSRDFLKNLGVKEDVFSKPDALKKAYFDLAKKYHPDIKGGNAKTMESINKAFKMVTDTFYDVAKTGDKSTIAGLLTDGEHTSQEVIGQVIKSGQEKTVQGKALIKSAVEAQQKGQNITISKPQPPVEGGVTVYRGGSKLDVNKGKGYGISVSTNPNVAKDFGVGGVVEKFTLSPNAKIATTEDINALARKITPNVSPEIAEEIFRFNLWNENPKAIKFIRDAGFDGAKMDSSSMYNEGEIRVFNSKILEAPKTVVEGGVKEGVKTADEYIKSLSTTELDKRAAQFNTPEEFVKSFEGDLKNIKFDETVKNLPQEEITPEVQRIREKVSQKDFMDIAEKFFPQVRDFYANDNIHSVDDYLKKIDPETIALEMESDYRTNQNFRTLIGKDDLANEIQISNIVDEYFAKTLPEDIYKEPFSIKDQNIKNVPLSRQGKFYETTQPKNTQDVKQLYQLATTRSTKSNQKSILEARKELYLRWATNKNLATELGIKPTELNRKIKTMTGANVSSVQTQNYLNQNIPEQFQWTGVTNSNYISKTHISLDNLDNVVGNIDDKTGKLNTYIGEMLRDYIMNTFLSIDTRLSYDDLNFNIETLDHALGQYDNQKTLITISQTSQNTVAHEIGHYLDYRFAREMGLDLKGLSDGNYNYEYIQKNYNLSDEHIAWAKKFEGFINNLILKGEAGYEAKRAEYLQTPTEVFARFVAKFVDWTAKQSGYHHSELNYYSDHFDTSDFHNFIKLLQKKAEIDTKYNIKPLVKGGGEKINTLEKVNEIEKIKKYLTNYYNEKIADKTLLESEQAKQIETQDTEHNKKVREQIQNLQENVELRRQENEATKSILDQFTGKQIQAMRTIKRSMNILENKGLDTERVSELKSYQDHIRDVMVAIGTDSEAEALRYIKEDLPDPIIEANTREDLQKIKVLRTHIIPKEATAPKEQLPVGEGKLKVSKLEARMKGVVGNATEDQIDNLGLSTYQEMNKKDQIAKASEYVVNNKEEALNVLRGKVSPPNGIIPESIYIALTELAKDDLTLVTKLSTLQATALGQRISILSEIDKDNPVRLLNEVYKVRAEAVIKKYGSVEKATKNVIKTIKEKVKVPDKYDWNEFLKSIECK